MSNKSYARITSLIFFIITIVHTLRLLLGWEINIGATILPMWISWIAVFLAGCLAITGHKVSKRSL